MFIEIDTVPTSRHIYFTEASINSMQNFCFYITTLIISIIILLIKSLQNIVSIWQKCDATIKIIAIGWLKKNFS